MGFWSDVGNVAKSITKVAKPIAAGVAIVYPPAAPVAAGIFVADKALNAAQPPPKPGSPAFGGLIAKLQAAQAVKGGPPIPAPALAKQLETKLVARHVAGQRIIKNTFDEAAKGDKNAARGATLIVKRAAARREARRWKLRGGRLVRGH